MGSIVLILEWKTLKGVPHKGPGNSAAGKNHNRRLVIVGKGI